MGLVSTGNGGEGMGRGSPGPRRGGGLLACALAWAWTASLLPMAATSAAGSPADALTGEPLEITLPPGTRAHRITVPEGNYRVTVRLEGSRGELAAVWAEQRRLVVDGLAFTRRSREVSFIVNVRVPSLGELPENATGGTAVRLKPREIGSASWDEFLSVEVQGATLRALRVESVDLPTLYLAGDSTVKDQPDAPAGSWGQFLPRYFGPGIAVANHAESGETLKSFVTEHRFDKLLSRLRGGDWVMIQFGHNDQKSQWPQTYADAATTYRDWLRVYLAEIRRRGATPLLVTSPERRNFDTDGRIRPTLADDARAMREVAREEQVALIDLNAASIRLYEALGPAIAPRAFADGGHDRTHHSDYGARLLARAVIEGLRGANKGFTGGLEKHIAADAGTLDLADPPLPEPPTNGRRKQARSQDEAHP